MPRFRLYLSLLDVTCKYSPAVKSEAHPNLKLPRKFRCLAPTGDWCGEAPVWNEAQQALYWTDINRCLIHSFRLKDGSVRTWFLPEPVTALALTAADDILAVALASRVVLWNSASGSLLETLFQLEGWPKVRLNDGRADPRGSLWVGTMWNNVRADGTEDEVGGRDGVLYRIDPDNHVSVWERGIGIANTVAWSPDGRRFYFADSLANAIDVYDYDFATGSIANRKPFLHGFARGVPDGSAVDSEGYLWNCRHGGGCIVRVAPNGTIDEVIEFPTPRPTSCTFGGENLETLYVTSSALGTTGDRLAGGLFAMEPGVRGQPENRFAGLDASAIFRH